MPTAIDVFEKVRGHERAEQLRAAREADLLPYFRRLESPAAPVVEMEGGFMFVMSISDGSCLAVLAASTCNVGVVAYEMAVLVARAGDVLTPSLRAELQATLPTT